MVQIVLIAESMRLQAMMATYGIQTQTPHEVEPVQIWSSTQLVKVYENLGVNRKLNLQGRPARPIGSLGTSKVSIFITKVAVKFLRQNSATYQNKVESDSSSLPKVNGRFSCIF